MREFLQKWKKYFVFAALLSAFINLLQLTFPFYMFLIYRNIVITYSGINLTSITVAALYAILIYGVFEYLRSRLLIVAGNDLNQSLRTPLVSNMLKSYAGPQKKTYFQATNDLETLRSYFTNQGIYALFDAPWAPLYLMLIYFFHPALGIIATIGAVVMVLLSLVQEFLTRNRMRYANQVNSKNQRFIDTSLKNAEVINSMGMLTGVAGRWDEKNREVINNQTIASRYAGLIQSILKPLQNVMQVGIYGYGAYLALQGEMTIGLMVASAIIMGRAIGPLMQAISSWKFTLQARDAYTRLDNFFTVLEKQKDKTDLATPQGKVSAERVSFVIGKVPLLKNVSFSLEAGEFLGVVGPSGAGKTTLCKLILGVWPSMGGKMRLDGADIFAWDFEKIGRYIGYLPQEIELFPDSVARNIARLSEPDQEKLHKAIHLAGIEDLIQSFPQGEDTQLYGENGITPSGGQKQRIGLARALYGDPVLLVLDEPNSNLDEAAEDVLIQSLNRLHEQRTCSCIMVTHKPQLLSAMDKILVLQSGQVAMCEQRDLALKYLTQPQKAQKANMQTVEYGYTP